MIPSPPDPDPTNNYSEVTSTVVTQADLSVTNAGPAAANTGTNVAYNITVTNNGPSDA